MKRVGLLVTLIYLLAACGGAQEGHDEMHEEHTAEDHAEHTADSEEWAEAESFHEIMALTYHPMRDEGKMEPVSENANELLEKAKVWAAAEVPGDLDKAMISEQLGALVSQSEELVTLVNNEATEDELKAKVNEIHDTFHGIHEMMEGGEHGEHHEDGEGEHPDSEGEHPEEGEHPDEG